LSHRVGYAVELDAMPMNVTDPEEELKATRARPNSPPTSLVGALILLGMFVVVIAVLILSNAHSVQPR